MVNDQEQQQQQVFAALADATRRSLLAHLAAESPKTATQLAQAYPITRQAVLKHLTVLERAGLVRVQQAGRDMRYTLAPEPLGELGAWVDALNATWDERLQRLKRLVEDEPAAE